MHLTKPAHHTVELCSWFQEQTSLLADSTKDYDLVRKRVFGRWVIANGTFDQPAVVEPEIEFEFGMWTSRSYSHPSLDIRLRDHGEAHISHQGIPSHLKDSITINRFFLIVHPLSYNQLPGTPQNGPPPARHQLRL